MQTNKLGIDLIKHYEGLRLQSYQDGGGVWTIGYGHTGPEVVKGLLWPVLTAEKTFSIDLAKFEAGLSECLKTTLNSNQFSAIVALAYNIGLAAFKTSTLLKKLNAGLFDEAADQFLRWDHDNGKAVAGLTARRQAERTLFCSK